MADSQNSTWKRSRDIAIGAVLSLGVTVIGGIAVYYLTRTPPSREEITYSLDPLTRFSAEKTHLAFTTLRVSNAGTLPARNVRIVVQPVPGTTIRDKKVSLSSGAAATFTVTDTGRTKYGLVVPVLATGELASIGLVFDGDVPGEPTISIKSEASIGKHQLVSAAADAKRRSFPTDLIPAFAAILLGAQVLLLYVLKRGRSGVNTYAGTNNAGFVLLHSGLTDRAVQILEDSLRSRGANDSHPLANLALAQDLSGNRDLADGLINAAQFYATSSHERAVLDFNRALIAFNRGDSTSGAALLRSAIKLSRKEIRRYLNLSLLTQKMSADAATGQAIKDAQGGK